MVVKSFRPNDANTKCCLISQSIERSWGGGEEMKVTNVAHAYVVSALPVTFDIIALASLKHCVNETIMRYSKFSGN